MNFKIFKRPPTCFSYNFERRERRGNISRNDEVGEKKKKEQLDGVYSKLEKTGSNDSCYEICGYNFLLAEKENARGEKKMFYRSKKNILEHRHVKKKIV